MDIDQRLNELTKTQSGLFTSRQARDLGLSPEDIRARVRRDSHVHVTRHVYAVAGMPISPRVLLHAAVLEASGRSVVSHSSAAAHWGMEGFTLAPFQITRLRDGTFEPTTLGRVHTTQRLPDTHVVDVDGLLITSPTRTLFDLSSQIGRDRLERLLEACLHRRITSIQLLRRTLCELSGKGQRGVVAMRALVEARPVGYVPAESGLELRAIRMLEEAAITGWRRQVEVHDADGLIGRVDLLHERRMLIVEIDSDLHHTSLSDVRADQVRQRRLEAQGYAVVRITEHEVWHPSRALYARVREALDRARCR